MERRDWEHKKHFDEWLASRFTGKNTVYVGIDLLPVRTRDGVHEWLTEDIVKQTAYRLRNKLNHEYFGKAARRYGKSLEITISHHTTPHPHLHAVIERPEGESFLKFKSKISHICLNDGWMKPMVDISETESVIAAQVYNNRFRVDSVVVF